MYSSTVVFLGISEGSLLYPHSEPYKPHAEAQRFDGLLQLSIRAGDLGRQLELTLEMIHERG